MEVRGLCELVGLCSICRLQEVCLSLPFPASVILMSLTASQSPSACSMDANDYTGHLSNPDSICTKGTLLNHTFTVPLSWEATHPWVPLVRAQTSASSPRNIPLLFPSFSVLPICASDGAQGPEHGINASSVLHLQQPNCTTSVRPNRLQ